MNSNKTMIMMMKEFKKKHDYDEGIQIKTMIMIKESKQNPRNLLSHLPMLGYRCLNKDATKRPQSPIPLPSSKTFSDGI